MKHEFEQLVLDYQDLIYTVCYKIVNDFGDAENLAQDTFLTAYSSLSDFRGDNIKAWLCRIAANKSIDHRRKHRVFEDIDEHAEVARAVGSSVEEMIEQKERAEKLNAILAYIPEKYSSVVYSFYYDQLPVKEIARQRRLPEKTIETQLYRARKLIKERWGDDDI